MGVGNKVFRDPNYPNVAIKQYSPNLSVRDFLPFVSPDVFPFLVDVAPIHLDMIGDVIRSVRILFIRFRRLALRI
jgi:hypothetical protein